MSDSALRPPRVVLALGAALLLLVGLLAGLLALLTPDRPGSPAAAAAGDPVVTIAGDIGVGTADAATAALVERLAPTVALTAGDNAYSDGTQANYLTNYDPDWGRFKAITRPSPGNHDYHPEAGNPPYYYTYFADQLPAENGGQYYAFDLGAWRLYSLNCEIDCSATSPQLAWLRNDLATSGVGKNKLAYLHRPRYSCGSNHGSDSRPVALWGALLAARADLVVGAHDHNYQRFPRMDSAGNTSADGIASFVAGTGGNGLYTLGSGPVGCSHLAYGQDTAHGVLKLTLGASNYSWEFVATDDTVMDSGTAATLGTGTPGPDPTGTETATTPPPPPATTTLDVRVAAGPDDAEERLSGSVALASNDLELVTDGSRVQTVGMRFAGVAVPAGATITAAHVQFRTDEVSSGPTSLTVQGLAADDVRQFTTVSRDVSSRARTLASVAWAPPDWPVVGASGADQRTPDLAALVQEVVNRPGWASGNALGVVVTGSGRRTATSADGSGGPVLHLEFTTGPVTNRAPVVDAGPDSSAVDGSAVALDATVTDDGLPAPAALTTSWSQDAGPGAATFADAGSVDTTATFPGPGDYVLRLTADDGEKTTSDTVLVTMRPRATTRTLEVAVAASSDDAEERVGGSTALASSDLELVADGSRQQVVGLRFTGVSIPRDAAVTRAWVQFQADEVTTGAASLRVRGQAADNAATFTASAGSVSGRPGTTATVGWTPPGWTTIGARGPDQRTADLSPVVQEIVSRAGWSSGNALVLVVTGTGTRTAEAFDGGAAPVLHVEYAG